MEESMKNKLIILVMIVILMIYAGYHVFFNNESKIQAEERIVEKEKVIATDLRIGVLTFDNINPILSQSRNVQEIARLIFEPLIYLTEDFRLEPGLAREWTQLDDMHYVIKLNNNTKWQDGYLFDADDVIFTIDRIKQFKKKSIYYYNVENIKTVTKIDEHTIKIKLKEADPFFEYNLIFPVMSSKYFNENNFTSERKNKNPVGTGMYYIAEKSDTKLLLKPNVNWWQSKKITIDTIQVNIYQTMNDELDAFKDKNIDIMTSSNRNIEDYLKDEQYQKTAVINRNYEYLAFNCEHPLLKKKAMRKVIAHSINQEEIVNKLFHDTYQVSYFPLDFGCYLYDGASKTNKMSKEEIEKILKQEHWKNSNGTWKKVVNGRNIQLRLNLLVNADNQEEMRVAENIQSQLNKVNIGITIKKYHKEQYQKRVENSNYEMALVNKKFAYSPNLQSYYGKGNVSRYHSDEMKVLMNQLAKEKEETEAKKEVSQIKAIYDKEIPNMGLYYDTIMMLYSTHLKGKITPTSYNLFYHVEGWYREYQK